MTHRALALLIAGATLLGVAPAASAHIQVAPAIVAPNDPVKFTVLVPGEKTARTTKVDLKVPAGLLTFSYEDPPGWTRNLVKAKNGAVDQIVWSGTLPQDGFVEFSFLAGTPEKPGDLVWKALQTYSDGSIVRWIGPPDSDEPAPVTHVVKGAPLQNAGGEGSSSPASAGAAPAGTAPVATTTAIAAAATITTDNSGRPDWVARILSIVAILACAALAVQHHRRQAAATR